MEEEIILNGEKFTAVKVQWPGAPLLIIYGQNGFIGCGYINLETAERLGAAFALVTGVKCFEDMLNQPVKAVSSAAESLQVTPGMTGKEALLLMK